MKKGELLRLVETVGREFGADNGIYFAMAEAGRAAALDRVGAMFNGPWTPEASKPKAKRPPPAAKFVRVKGGNGSRAELTAFGRKVRGAAGTNALASDRKPRPRKSPSTVLAQVSTSSKEAIDTTATEDVLKAVRDGSGTAAMIATATALPTTAVSRILTKLTRAGTVVKTGTRRGCRYAVPGAEAQTGLGL